MFGTGTQIVGMLFSLTELFSWLGIFLQTGTFNLGRHHLVNNQQKLTEPDFLEKFSFGHIWLNCGCINFLHPVLHLGKL